MDPVASAPSPEWMAGEEQLPWSWAVDRLTRERNYWLTTARRDGFPQARPVWGVWSDVGLLLSVGHGGLQRTSRQPAMPVTAHTDDAIEVVIVEGVIDRVAGRGARDLVDASIKQDAVGRYNAKYSWDFDVNGDGLNFLVRPFLVYGWRSTPSRVEGGTRWRFPPPH